MPLTFGKLLQIKREIENVLDQYDLSDQDKLEILNELRMELEIKRRGYGQ